MILMRHIWLRMRIAHWSGSLSSYRRGPPRAIKQDWKRNNGISGFLHSAEGVTNQSVGAGLGGGMNTVINCVKTPSYRGYNSKTKQNKKNRRNLKSKYWENESIFRYVPGQRWQSQRSQSDFDQIKFLSHSYP